MNVHVLGEDYSSVNTMLGVDIMDILNTTLNYAGKAAEIAIPVINAARKTPTEKSLTNSVTGTSTSMPQPMPPKPDFMKANMPYILIGGAVLVGAIIMMEMRKK